MAAIQDGWQHAEVEGGPELSSVQFLCKSLCGMVELWQPFL